MRRLSLLLAVLCLLVAAACTPPTAPTSNPSTAIDRPVHVSVDRS